ncbi:hypothetical protein [Klebsiella quasipneumoniae]|uniref:hypothetical protein n=1 Tax=Klebsiella quasipneumoniae TaxID=1463165 RepID=UPI00296EB996|nr:hypothetical protein [Klebsiella quasipneumoniae]
MPKNGPRPDCINAAGCLFCTQHRDIESEDHVWSLGSLRHLKSLELARYRPSSSGKHLTTEHPALLVIDRLTAKLRFFEESSEVRRLWVEEARARISEGDYHPARMASSDWQNCDKDQHDEKYSFRTWPRHRLAPSDS